MKKVEFYSQYGDNLPTSTKEVFSKPSLTEPDNALSIPEIVARFTRGQGIVVPQHPWQGGAAPEDGEGPVEDNSLEAVLEIQKPAEQEKPTQEQKPAEQEKPAEPTPPLAGA